MPVSQTNADHMWSSVATLRPRLRQHVRFHRHEYRGEQWYILHDEASGRFLRFNAAAYEVVGRFDGEFSLQGIWEHTSSILNEDAPTQEEIMQILAQLHAAEALHNDPPLSAQQAIGCYSPRTKSRSQRALANPLALRIRLFDPDRLLEWFAPIARPAFSWAGILLWMIVVAAGGLLAVSEAEQLGHTLDKSLFSPRNMLLLWFIYPCLKALHELGHGLAAKIWGGAVHEMGIMFLVFMPVPYVNASAALAIRDKWKRAAVGAAGILVEIFLAAIGVLVWAAVEPGLIQDAALNVALIGGISTLLANGNPMVRFDGYYVLEDLIEIPNLAQRSSRYWLYLLQRYLLGLNDVRSPVSASGERGWFLCYGLASPVYQLLMMIGIALWLADQFLVVGVALATWAVFRQMVAPIMRAVVFIAVHPRLCGRRARATTMTLLLIAVAMGALVLVPAPLTTSAEGVVRVPDQAQVYAGADGFVQEVLVGSGSQVKSGDPLLRVNDPEIITRIAVTKAHLDELYTREAAERLRDRVRAQVITQDIAAARAELARLHERVAAFLIKSQAEGTFVMPGWHKATGRFVRQGEVVGFLIGQTRFIVRAVVSQDDIGLLRTRGARASVKLAENLRLAYPARILREVPSASSRLPSPALGTAGGGVIAVDYTDEAGLTAAQRVFQVDLELLGNAVVAGVGGRAYVRFEHGTEPFGYQWVRAIRQLLLSRLST